MCGIGGVWHQEGEPVRLDLLRRMGDRLIHRGPDDAGFLLDDLERPARLLGADDPDEVGAAPLGLLHRRLSIIDVAGGHQPIANEDRTCFVVLNGEIYNHQDLRRELEGNGHRFRTRSDTEVVLHLYEEHGPPGVERLDGIFAYAIWDRTAQSLLLARDRLGAKPLYLVRSGSRLAFASEVKALLLLPWLRAEADPLAVLEHFTFQNTFGERTFFRGVELLPAGHWMLADAGGARTERYWELEYAEEAGRGLDDWARDVRDVFTGAVTAQLMSEVPVGTYLSGGMDTGAISAVAARSIDPLHTFTCGFDLEGGVDHEEERHFDEREAAAALAGVLGTVHHEMTVRPGDLEAVLPALVWHLDEPRVGISYQNHLVAGLAGSEVTVVLSGVGGDELFGGYPWRYRRVRAWKDEATFLDGYYRLWQRLVPEDQHASFFGAGLRRELGDVTPRESAAAVLSGVAVGDPVHRAMWFDAKTFLHGLLLVEDKLSMAHSVESRVPFCANDLLDLVRRIPSSLKLGEQDTKIVLKAAFRGLLPDETLTRPKVGFTPPDATWYRGPMARYVEGILLSDRALSRGWFRPEAVHRVVDEHQSGNHNHRFLLWSLMCFEWWNRLFLEQDVESAFPAGPAGLASVAARSPYGS